MSLWLLQKASATESDGINDTVYIENGTESADLQCGEVPSNAIAIEWYLYKTDQLIRILRLNKNTPNRIPEYYNGYTADKYGISESMNTSLVVKNIQLSDTGLFSCGIIGRSWAYGNYTILQVVGKSLLAYLVLGFLIHPNFNTFALLPPVVCNCMLFFLFETY